MAGTVSHWQSIWYQMVLMMMLITAGFLSVGVPVLTVIEFLPELISKRTVHMSRLSQTEMQLSEHVS